jgi:hypothetical protein
MMTVRGELRMSDNPTKPYPSEHETPASAEEGRPRPVGGDSGGTWKAWLVIGCLGSTLLVAACAFVGGIVYLVASSEDEAQADVTPTPSVADEPIESPTATPVVVEEAEETPASTPVPEDEVEEPTPTAEPDAPTPETAFGPGQQVIGDDIEPGIYFANEADEFCYWERVSGLSEEIDDIIANQIVDYRAIVEVSESDAGFYSERCGDWEDGPRIDREDPTATFDAGTYLVNDEIAPGTWQSQGASESCYWERLSGFSGELDHIIENQFGEVDPIVEISPDDVAFESAECGQWVYVDE